MNRSLTRLVTLAFAVIGLAAGLAAQNGPGDASKSRGGGNGSGGGGAGGGGRMPTLLFRTEVPAHPYDLVLGRPTATSITLSVLCYADADVTVTLLAPEPAKPLPSRRLRAGEPQHWLLDGLKPATRHRYRVQITAADGASTTSEHEFTTARAAGEPFTFTIQADSHLDGGTSPELYLRSLANVLAAKADFHVDLGDTFMTEKRTAYKEALPQYLAQRFYLGQIGHSVPVFLALGNHDGEEPARGGSGADSMSGWSLTTRKRYFPNPEPDGFYSGNRTPHPHAGALQDYYAWTWGDALFVVLDPFWFTPRLPRDGDNWPRTLGREQYDWLEKTLRSSRARYKFVFLHHLVGGESKDARGGAEASRFFEWGGCDADGTDGFARNRPGWPAPIHELLMQTHVSAVFHGHDHLYVKQERDGIVYQAVPQPAHPRANARSAADYGYRSGDILAGSGILRVRVAPESATVDFVTVGSAENPAASYRIAPAP